MKVTTSCSDNWVAQATRLFITESEKIDQTLTTKAKDDRIPHGTEDRGGGLCLQGGCLIPENSRMKDIRFKLIADKEVESKLSESQIFKIEKSTPVKDPIRLGFDLHSIVEIVTLVSTAITAAKTAKELSDLLRETKAKKAVLQTPLRTIEVHEDNNREDQIRQFFEAEFGR